MRERAVPVLCELASRRDCGTGSLDVESASRGMLASASRGIVLDMYNSLVLWLTPQPSVTSPSNLWGT